MMHVTMIFDVAAWARWREKRRLDPRGINFVLTYPRMVMGGKTTPRSLVHCFEVIFIIDNLSQEIVLVRIRDIYPAAFASLTSPLQIHPGCKKRALTHFSSRMI